MYDLLQLFYLAQQLGNVKAINMSMYCLCRLDLTADVESESHDAVGQVVSALPKLSRISKPCFAMLELGYLSVMLAFVMHKCSAFADKATLHRLRTLQCRHAIIRKAC